MWHWPFVESMPALATPTVMAASKLRFTATTSAASDVDDRSKPPRARWQHTSAVEHAVVTDADAPRSPST